MSEVSASVKSAIRFSTLSKGWFAVVRRTAASVLSRADVRDIEQDVDAIRAEISEQVEDLFNA
jgi:hypothetical protein